MRRCGQHRGRNAGSGAALARRSEREDGGTRNRVTGDVRAAQSGAVRDYIPSTVSRKPAVIGYRVGGIVREGTAIFRKWTRAYRAVQDYRLWGAASCRWVSSG